ncbi:amidase [Halomicroarcula limicola]|uniref:Amidase n=1 Tax=Haloarcula limicola TaxID=1429915 RepID=A0A8J7Y755_9EURY|nr:amidase [Halomicroarcula limicola]MBV0925950.1 amidase [Halomicroarcula limicola]
MVDAHLERIEEREDDLNAFITLLEEEAREEAKEAERAVRTDAKLGPLHGVPIAVKDLLGKIEGVPNTLGAKPLENVVANETAILVQRLKDAGAIVVGTTNTPEFAHKGQTDNLLIGETPTPFDLNRTSGGSSGGSAAAVASGMVPIATGSDAGGSCRIPAAACGVFGYCPSFTRVPNKHRPNMFVAPPFFQAGALSRSVSDAAVMLDVMTGPHPQDPFGLPDDGIDYVEATNRSIEDLDIAYNPDLDGLFPIDPKVKSVLEDSLEAFETLDANVEEVEIGIEQTFDQLWDAFMDHWSVTMAGINEGVKIEHGIDMYADHREELPESIVEKVEEGQEMGALELGAHQAQITDFYETIHRLFEEYDLLATPTLAIEPPSTEYVSGPPEINGKERPSALGWFLTWPFNFTATPNASLPAGFTENGLPVGLQIIGPRYHDERVFAASAGFERVNPWSDAYPPQ